MTDDKYISDIITRLSKTAYLSTITPMTEDNLVIYDKSNGGKFNHNCKIFDLDGDTFEVYYPYVYQPVGQSHYIVCNFKKLQVSKNLIIQLALLIDKLNDNILDTLSPLRKKYSIPIKELKERCKEFDVFKDGCLDRISLDSLTDYYER